jgi:hypothetical protein
LLLLVLLVSLQVNAADYYWFRNGTTLSFPTPQAACDHYGRGASIPSWRPNDTHVTSVVTMISDSEARCRIASQPSDTNINTYVLYRGGDSCPAGTEYDSATGSCVQPEPDQCESTAGNNVDHMHRMGDFTGAGVVGGYVAPPGVVCDGGCQYASNQQPAKDAFRFVNGDPSGVYGSYSYKGNGVSCTGGEATRSQPANGTPTADKNSQCTNKVTDAEGRQQYSCTSTDKYTDIGSMNCGVVNGEHKCVPVPPKPKMTDKTTTVDVTQKTNPDGSTDTTTTTTTTTVNCSGVNACTTTTTTSTTTNHTKPDGSPGGETTTCTGPGCPDGNGQTQEDREEQEQEEEPESSVSGGQTCEAAPTCEGDAVQCAILKQQYEARCDYEEAMDYDGKKADIEGLFQGEQFELKESEISAPSFINSATRFLPSGCPPPETINLTSNGGHTFQLKYDPICRVASDFSWLIVAFVSLFSALYVGRAFGGE